MKAVDLFAGCGGLSLGLQNAGIDIIAGFDNWLPAVTVYEENFKHPVFVQDLRDILQSVAQIDKLNPDLIAGGPPCQDFSSAGLRNLDGGRADLTFSFADIVCNILPNFFIMENVSQIRKSYILPQIMQQFSEAGYGLTAAILDASYCGAPQSRLRFFLVGHLGAENNFLTSYLIEKLSQKPMTMKEYFGDSLGTKYYYRHPRSYKRRGIYTLDEPSATIRGVNRPIPPNYVLHANDPQGISLNEVRPLSTSERAQVQTFPATFKFSGAKTVVEQMIGNAVPVVLASFVGSALMQYLETGEIKKALQLDLPQNISNLIPARALVPVAK